MSTPVMIIDVLRDVVSATSAKLLTQLQAVDSKITGVHFEYGHYTDINERLVAKAKAAKADRLPMIAVLEDFKLSRGAVNVTGDNLPIIVILSGTQANYTRVQRDEKVFDPVLWPIYNEFLLQLKISGMFMIYDVTKIPHDVIMRPHHGKAEGFKNIAYYFGEPMDGLEISNLKLTTFLNSCPSNKRVSNI